MMRIRSSLAPEGTLPGPTRILAKNERRPLGEGLGLTLEQQELVNKKQAETGRLFGDTAVELGFVSEAMLRRAIEQQHRFPVLSEDDGRIDPLVVSAFNPEDELARNARNLRGIVTAATRADGQSVRSVALVGLDVLAELPIIAANLAVACAQTGMLTLLIDAEIDHPNQHALFRAPNRAGLSTLLSSNQQAGFVQAVAIEGLSIISSGPAVPNASELFDRQRLSSVTQLFVETFDLVLVDTGCGTTSLAAALGLDASIVVLRRNVTSTRKLRTLVQQLEDNGHVVLGTVLVD